MSQSIHYLIKPDPQASFTLEVYKTGLLKGKKHVFLFERYQGDLIFFPDNPEAAQITFSLESDSMTLRDNWVNERDHRKILLLAKEEILEAGLYPEIRFDSTRVTKTFGEYSVRGNLAIKSTIKPVYLEIRIGPNQSENLQIEGASQIKLSDFGFKRPSVLLGAIGTRDLISARFSLVALPAAPAKHAADSVDRPD
jgi:polyisoprenoid-binding protein YceI